MTAATSIVLADAQATPVNHTFIPKGRDASGVFWYEDQSQANTVGYWRIAISQKYPPVATAGTASNDDRQYRVKVSLYEPILANVTNSTVSGVEPAPQIAYVNRSNTDFALPERGVKLDRSNVRKMTGNLMLHADVVAIVDDMMSLT